ncbi:MAG TPA: hypothetical protein PKK10_10900 [Woeseiaceae bacterium]|nr:hypothetical protein [Woeseiaceae bacterium]
MNAQHGYSETPLARKLGITEGCSVVTMHAPQEYKKWLAPLPPGVQFTATVTNATDIVHIFSTERSVLASELPVLRKAIRPDGTIWTSWPKKSSRVLTDITEDTIREVCLPLGLVDVKVCAVSDIWSALKLVIRKELR